MDGDASITELVPDVYVLDSPFFQSKRALIVDADGSVLIDTPVSFRETEMLLTTAESKGLSVRRVVLTHSHFDHSAGCQLLPQAERIAQHGASRWMTSRHAADYLARRPPEHPDLPRVQVTLPTLEVQGAAILRLRQRALHLLPTPGHSPDGMSILLEPDGVLFTGDSLVTCFPPIFTDGDSSDSVATFKRILGLDFAYVVPVHGPVLRADEARRHCQTSLAYLEELKHRLAQLEPETSLEGLRSSVDDLPGAFSLPPEATIRWHERAVLKVWEELHG